MTKVLAFAIHNTAPWWTYMMRNLDFAEGVVVSDIRGDGDYDIVDDFYAAMRLNGPGVARAVFGEDGCADIIRRCRVLRNLPQKRALKMIGGMYSAITKVFDREKPDLAMALTIDRYTTDIASRIAESRGLQFLEMTVSIIPSEVMFLKRGVLQPLWQPTKRDLDDRVAQVYSPDFVPFEVDNLQVFSRKRFYSTIAYFEARGLAFNAMRFLKRDPSNLHYLDAQRVLDHKARLSDVAVLDMFDKDWRSKIETAPKEKRVFLGLQLFPEASMDYWLKSRDMLDHDQVILRYCDVLRDEGYRLFVKDHPLQFGFRKKDLMTQLASRSNVTLVPYQVPAQTMITLCGASVTLTGTIGFQAALAGLISVVSEPYYSTEDHYIQVRRFDEIESIAAKMREGAIPKDMDTRRRNLLKKLAGGSVPGDYFTFRKFDRENAALREAIAPLVQSLNTYLPKFMTRD